jgi:hypothetical protein
MEKARKSCKTLTRKQERIWKRKLYRIDHTQRTAHRCKAAFGPSISTFIERKRESAWDPPPPPNISTDLPNLPTYLHSITRRLPHIAACLFYSGLPRMGMHGV